MSVKENTRVQWLDVCRGIGILFVLLIHSIPAVVREESLMANEIYKFLMTIGRQLLFLLSGYTLQLMMNREEKLETKKFIGKKIRSILKPYIVYGSIILIIFTSMNYIPTLNKILVSTNYGQVNLRKALYGIIMGEIPYALHLWFLYDLFIFIIVTYFIKRYIKHSNVVIIVIAVILWKVLYVRDWGNLIAIVNLMFFYIWFAIGSCIKINHKNIIRNVRHYIISSFIALLICWMGAIYIENINDLITTNWIVALTVNLLKTGSLVYLCIISSVIATGKLKNYLSIFGVRSMDLYLFQQPFFGSVLGTVLFKIKIIPIAGIVLITFCISLMATLMISSLLDKVNFFRRFIR